MIIKGKSRSGPGELAAHLGNAEKNEKVRLLEVRGTIAQDLRGALIEMTAYAAGSRCELPLYHVAVSPATPHRLSREQIFEAVDALEQELGLGGHARVIVLHEKDGREHIHPVWARIDLHTMKAVHDGHNYRKHETVSRDLERRFGHDRVQGAHAEREGPDGEKVPRPDRSPSRAELRQEERTGIPGKAVKAEVTAIFRQSDSAEAFKAGLEVMGYQLAPGDRRDFVIVDKAGGVHSLARRIDGVNAAPLRDFMAPIDREKLPSIEGAQEIAERRRAGHEEAMIEKGYSRGADYASQTSAALKDFQRRQKALNGDPRPMHPEDRDAQRRQAEERAAEEEGRDRSRREAAREEAEKSHAAEKSGRRPDTIEMTEAQVARMDRLLNREQSDRDLSDGPDDDPDRQREAPGGGRTRSR